MRFLVPILILSSLHWASPTASAVQAQNPPQQARQRARTQAEEIFPTFLTHEQLIEALTMAQCADAVPSKTLGTLYLEQEKAYLEWSGRAKTPFLEAVTAILSLGRGLDEQTTLVVLKAWGDEQTIEKALFNEIITAAPEEARLRVNLAWAMRHSSFLGDRTDRVAASVHGKGRIGQIDLVECLSRCSAIDLGEKQIVEWALAYERQRAQLLQELTAAGLSAQVRSSRATQMSQKWISDRRRANPEAQVDQQASMAVTMALQIAPMICLLDEITEFQKQTIDAIAVSLDPMQAWCLYAEASASALLRGRQATFRTRLRSAWERASGNTPEDILRRQEIETFQAADLQRLAAWLDLIASQLSRQSIILSPMVDLDTVDIEEVALMIESEGDLFTSGNLPHAQLHQRYLILKGFVDGLDAPVEDATPNSVSP